MFEGQQEQQAPELLLMRDRPGSIYAFDAVTTDELSVRLESLSPEEKAQKLFGALSEAPADPVDWEPSGIKSYGYNPYHHAVGSVFEAAARDRDTATKFAELLAQDSDRAESFLSTAAPEVLEIAFIRAWNVGDSIKRPDATPSLETFASLLGPRLPLEKLTEILQDRLTETSYRTLSITRPPDPGTRLTATLIEKAAEETKVLNIHAVKRAFSDHPALLATLEHANIKAKEHAYVENLRSSYIQLVKPFESAGQYPRWIQAVDTFRTHGLPVDLVEAVQADDANQSIAYLVSGFSNPELLETAEQRVETFLQALETNDPQTISEHAKKKAERVVTGLCNRIPADTDEGQQQFNRIVALVERIYPDESSDSRWYSLRHWRNKREKHLEHEQALAELGVDPNLPHSIAHIEIALPKGRISYADSDPATNQSNLRLDLAVYLNSLTYRGHQTTQESDRDLFKLTRDSDIREAIDQLDVWLEGSTEQPFTLPFGSGNRALQYTSYRTVTISRPDQNTFELRAEKHERPTQNPADELETFAAKTNRQVDYDSLPELSARIRPATEVFTSWTSYHLVTPFYTTLPLEFLNDVYRGLARLPEKSETPNPSQDSLEITQTTRNLAVTRGHLIFEVPGTTRTPSSEKQISNYSYQHSFTQEGHKHILFLPFVNIRPKEDIPLSQVEINQAQARFKDFVRLSRGTIKSIPGWYASPKSASMTSNNFA